MPETYFKDHFFTGWVASANIALVVLIYLVINGHDLDHELVGKIQGYLWVGHLAFATTVVLLSELLFNVPGERIQQFQKVIFGRLGFMSWLAWLPLWIVNITRSEANFKMMFTANLSDSRKIFETIGIIIPPVFLLSYVASIVSALVLIPLSILSTYKMARENFSCNK